MATEDLNSFSTFKAVRVEWKLKCHYTSASNWSTKEASRWNQRFQSRYCVKIHTFIWIDQRPNWTEPCSKCIYGSSCSLATVLQQNMSRIYVASIAFSLSRVKAAGLHEMCCAVESTHWHAAIRFSLQADLNLAVHIDHLQVDKGEDLHGQTGRAGVPVHHHFGECIQGTAVETQTVGLTDELNCTWSKTIIRKHRAKYIDSRIICWFSYYGFNTDLATALTHCHFWWHFFFLHPAQRWISFEWRDL